MENKTFSNEKKWKKYLFTLCTLGIYLWVCRQKRIAEEKLEKELAERRKKREKWEKKRDIEKEKAWKEYMELLSLACEKDPNDLFYMNDCINAWIKAEKKIEKWEKENPKP